MAIIISSSAISLQTKLQAVIDSLVSAGFEDPEREARFLVTGVLDLPVTQLYVDSEKTLSLVEDSCIEKALLRRKNREPLSYILGNHFFQGKQFIVDRRVLIPRYETELLVEACCEWLKFLPVSSPKILDVGTGSGCIALSLADFFPKAEVWAVDISEDALDVSRENAVSQKANNVRFLKSDLFNSFGPESIGDFDMIVSNPPYVSSSEMKQLEKDVLFEPELALHGGLEGLDVIARLTNEAPRYLKKGGSLFFEIGYKQGEEAQKMCRAAGLKNVSVLKDYQGHDRIIKGEWRGSI